MLQVPCLTDCDTCGGHLALDSRRAEISCESCGVVAQANLIEAACVVNFDLNGNPQQSGGPALPPSRSSSDLMTVIRVQRDAHGRALKNPYRVLRMAKLQQRTASNRGRSIRELSGVIYSIGTRVGVPKAV